MGNQFGIPEIEVEEVAAKLANGDPFILLDVRESQELLLANLGDGVVHVPLSRLAQERETAIPDVLQDKDQEIIVLCHHGMRSAQVAAFLKGSGWQNVINMAGGIDAYARRVDTSIGLY